MISMPEQLPDDPVLLKQLLEQMLSERESDNGKIVHLEEKRHCCISVFSAASQSRQPIPQPRKWPCSTKPKVWPNQMKKRS